MIRYQAGSLTDGPVGGGTPGRHNCTTTAVFFKHFFKKYNQLYPLLLRQEHSIHLVS
jgi:hypothetical protein